MPITNYPLKQTEYGASHPYLWIMLKNLQETRSIPLRALIDTGADDCCFPADIASGLDIDLKSGKCHSILTANGETRAYEHTCNIDILKMSPDGTAGKDVIHSMIVPVVFLENCEAFLLGSKNFLNNFKLTIDYPQQKFSLQLPKPV